MFAVKQATKPEVPIEDLRHAFRTLRDVADSPDGLIGNAGTFFEAAKALAMVILWREEKK